MPTIITSREVERLRNVARDVDQLRNVPVGVASAPTVSDIHDSSRREFRKRQSDARSKLWSNTLSGSRRAKEEQRRQRLEQLEADRVQLDNEERAHQLRANAAAIRNAKEKLVAESEKMKALRSQRMLSHTIDVREKQIAQKKAIEQLARQRDSEYHQRLLDDVALQEQREKDEHEKRLRQKKEVALSLRMQVDNARKARLAELKAREMEGQRLRVEAEEYAKLHQKEEERRRQYIREVNMKMRHENDLLIERRKREKLQEQEELEQHRKHQERKEQMELKKSALLDAKKTEAEARAERIGQIVANDFLSRKANEDASLERQQQQAAQQQREKDAAAMRRQMKLRDACVHDWETQMARKREQKAKLRAEDARNAERAVAAANTLLKQEQAEAARRRQRNRAIAEMQLAQAQQRQHEIAKHVAEERRAGGDATRRATSEDEEYNHAAQQFLKDEAEKQHNTAFAQKSLHRVARERLLPADATF